MSEDAWVPGQPVPDCSEYLLNLDRATGAQRAFYAWVAAQYANGRTPDVGGFGSYPFRYAFASVYEFKGNRDFPRLAGVFDLLLSGYGETLSPNETSMLRTWRFEAAALCDLWDEAWAHRAGTARILDLAHTVSARLGSSPRLTAADLSAVIFGGPTLTQHGIDNRAAVDEAVQVVLDEIHDAAGHNLFDSYCGTFHHRKDPIGDDELANLIEELDYRVESSRLRQAIEQQGSLDHWMTAPERTGEGPYETVKYYFGPDGVEFESEEERRSAAEALSARRVQEAALRPHDGLHSIEMVTTFTGGSGTRRVVAPGYSREDRKVTLHACTAFVNIVIEARAHIIFREAENQVRHAQGLPKVGQGWFGETQLFTQLRDRFPELHVQQHARPKWLAPQHLDVYLPGPNIAIEFQGSQHFGPVDYFGGEATFVDHRRRDAKKRAACESNGCLLIEVRTGYDLEALVEEIEMALDR